MVFLNLNFLISPQEWDTHCEERQTEESSILGNLNNSDLHSRDEVFPKISDLQFKSLSPEDLQHHYIALFLG